jgi:putative flavoprotein involved in K+ transport
MHKEILDTIIIGGGQAGLVTGYELQKSNRTFIILEKNKRVGDSWRNRYDSLTLFATRRYSQLPGLKLSGDPSAYPGKDELADYLEDYTKEFNLSVKAETHVTRLEKENETYHIQTNHNESFYAKSVVLATGGFDIPNVLKMSENLSENVKQFTPLNYQRPSQVPDGKVLIAGDGATGRQVAKELSKTHDVIMATGVQRKVKPQQIFGQDYFWWLDKLGFLRVTKESWFGKYMMRKAPFPGHQLNIIDLKKDGAKIVGLLEKAEGENVSFSTGETIKVKSILWALGYTYNFDWIKIKKATNERGDLIEYRGISPVEGLYTIGRMWQWTRGSATLTGVGADANYIINHMNDKLFD